VIVMRALVVYESMFGNTRDIAQAIAEGMGSRFATEVVEVSRAGTVFGPQMDLLVVGGPTQGFGLSRPGTRESAGRMAPDGLVSPAIGVREWLADLPAPAGDVAAAAFDTRLGKPRWLTGSAAQRIAKRLRLAGYRLVAEPTSFVVGSTTGPLVDGERDRARRWGETVATATGSRQPV
jgi:Flavodoxin